ncbi:response regulator transcription factor [Neobacillus mesonae]|uniref:response regulator n=1 Tax=Neobacillus mesonae TaxID=1193713 RepID=UPI00203E7A87|nr:response regulator transcription factor [Neobacillus mesonae]MCM3568638.1 response regulator transcription factor [Neobacillus mesonae]
MSKLRIVIADDQTLFREGLQTILSLEQDMEIVGAAGNGENALALVKQYRPDLVLMDVEMPVMNGIECTRIIKEQFPSTHIIILSTFAEDDYIVQGLVNGACGYLLKDLNADLLIQGIRDAATGQMILPAPIAAKLAAKLHQVSRNDRSPVTGQRNKLQEELTGREKEIAALMIKGYNNKEIATRLFISEGTVRNYISVMYSKIGTNDRAKAVMVFRDMTLDE